MRAHIGMLGRGGGSSAHIVMGKEEVGKGERERSSSSLFLGGGGPRLLQISFSGKSSSPGSVLQGGKKSRGAFRVSSLPVHFVNAMWHILAHVQVENCPSAI